MVWDLMDNGIGIWCGDVYVVCFVFFRIIWFLVWLDDVLKVIVMMMVFLEMVSC